MKQNILKTDRLILRPFTLDDAKDVQAIAGDKAVADTTEQIPHPYPDGVAEEWIATHAEAFAAGEAINCAIVLQDTGVLIGNVGLQIAKKDKRGLLGYWMKQSEWGNGYATEAATALINYAFEEHGLHKVYAEYISRNPASGRVMEKIGMKQEGILKEHMLKNGVYEDVVVCGMIVNELHVS
ncbi:GNAT family N-acetyltransferase [Patescibacteria group bacterium]|nr:GNAT family N-acetyltransferase [Patescibacteria group bacterium]MBU1721897.1 GNAT family N-acetyltransferase [Patescibacteria group bacterium]MBU1900871.1 GNAT family N-acetyltransferase [Patescibacteria group bacterium]